MEKITVVMPLYNKAKYLAEAIESYLRQKTLFESRLIIADDASSDNSFNIAKEYEERYPEKIKVTRNSENLGLLRNDLNVFETMKSDYFCVLDPDDYWIDVFFIQKAVDFLEAHDDFACYSSNTIILDQNGKQRPFINLNIDEYVTESIEDYLDNNAIIPHTTGSVYRNDIFKYGIPKIIRDAVGTVSEASFRGDHDRFVIHLKYGKAYFKNEYVGVYRLNETGIWFTASELHNHLLNAQARFDYSHFYEDVYYERFVALAEPYYNLAKQLSEKENNISKEDITRLQALDIEMGPRSKTENIKEIAEIISEILKMIADDREQVQELVKYVTHIANRQNYTIPHIDKEICAYEIELCNRRIEPNPKHPIPVVLSMTTFPGRIYEVKYAIYSLVKQTFMPDEFILWLSKDEFPRGELDIAESLLILLKKWNVQIKFWESDKSFKKIIPTLINYPDAIVVTADDDIFYDEDWLEKMYTDYLIHGEICCHRAHKVTLNNGEMIKYDEWPTAPEDSSSYSNFPTSVGGVLYPPHSLSEDAIKRDLYKQLTPLNDDIWIWAMALLNNRKIRKVANPMQLVYVNPERDMGISGAEKLSDTNVTNGYNEEQLSNIVQHYPHIYSLLRE